MVAMANDYVPIVSRSRRRLIWDHKQALGEVQRHRRQWMELAAAGRGGNWDRMCMQWALDRCHMIRTILEARRRDGAAARRDELEAAARWL